MFEQHQDHSGSQSQSGQVAEAHPDPRYTAARKRVRNLKHFYLHGLGYCLIVMALMIVDYFDGPAIWFHWVLIGWGAAVFLHGYRAYGHWRLFGAEWEKAKTAELLDNMDVSSE